MAHSISVSRRVPRHVTYGRLLRNDKESWFELKPGVFALKTCNDKGKLKNKYAIIEHKYIAERDEVFYVCSCGENTCLHIRELISILGLYDDFINEETEDLQYVYLTEKLIGVYSDVVKSYSIIRKTDAETTCLTCTKNVKNCPHIFSFMKYMANSEQPFDNVREYQTFKAISKEPIPYMLEDPADLDVFKNYVSGVGEYPTDLYPDYDSSLECIHGNLFSKEVMQLNSGWLHLAHYSREVYIYYRPVIGSCECRQHYDGRSQLLFNLDNNNIFSLIWFYQILNDMQEHHYTLHGAYRSANRTRLQGKQIVLKRAMYDKLRKAFNCFMRLLDLDYELFYECPDPGCRANPEKLVMDGIAMGGRKDLLPDLKIMPAPSEKIHGSTIDQRIFIRAAKPRKLLAKYANLTKGGREAENIEPLSDLDYGELCESLSNRPSLQDLIREAGNPCPKSVRTLAGELSRSTPLCGMLQITGDLHIQLRRVIEQVVNGSESDFLRRILDNLVMFQKSCPLIVNFLLSEDIRPFTKIQLLKDLIRSVNAPFAEQEEPSDEIYGPISDSNNVLGFFPNHPLLRGPGNYEADKYKDRESSGCRKQTKRHNRLNPGLFTIFCPHGVCYGFQLMVDAESPRIAFDIFVQRFSNIPQLLIYDNACKLHIYALKREPSRFQNTRFMVDRLHFPRGHVGCSLGYSMDTYVLDEDIRNVNSQVNEQANSNLRRLSTSFAYKSPENVIQHTKVFLAIRNMDKIGSMDF